MSQNGSSITGQNPELKYRKALMQIQKIHNANKVLKNQSEQMRDEYERQISQLNNMLQQNQKEYQALKHEKADIEKIYEELEISHSELRKEYTSLQREYAYLNDVLTQQNHQLKKVNAFKDQKGLTNLINSYEDKEMNYRKDINRLEQYIKNLKSNYQTIENELSEQKRQRFKLQDLNNNLRMEVNKYRQLNNTLINKNQNIVATLLNRSSEGKEKYREAETMLRELSKQLQLIKNTRIEQATSNKSTVSLQSYQNVLHQKSKLQIELLKLRQKLNQYQNKTISSFQMEQKMKKALLHAEQLQEQCNMLKGKLILIETKDAMDGSTQFGDLKELQEKILAGISQNDPLVSIKNGSDSSHFQLMKSYIIELKDKLSKAMIQKKEVEKKYRSLKEKLTDKAEKAISYEEQNKLLKGKLEGYERLTQRLQFELQRSIEAHDEQLTKMKSVTNNIINKKTQQVRVANAYVRAQLDLQLDKFQKTQKGLRQQVQTLKLEVSTQRIKNADLQQKYTQASQFLQIYQKKFNELTASSMVVEEDNQNLQENVSKFQQLYREERNKNETLLLQKQALNTKLAEISQEYEKKKYVEQQLANRFTQIEAQNKKTKSELVQAKNEIQNLQNILKISKKQFQDKSRIAMLDISRTQSSYYTALEHNFNQQKQRNKELQAQAQSLKLRLERALHQSQKVTNLQDGINSKNDQINDCKRKNIISEKQISLKEAELKQAKNESDILRRQNNALKAKLLQSGQQLRKSYEFKDFEGKKIAQKLNQQLSSALSELREERRISARMQSDVQSYRSEIQRLQTIIDQAKSKQMNLYEQSSQLRSSLQNASEQIQRQKKQIVFKNGLIDSLNNQMSAIQQKLFKTSQQSSQNKIKLQQVDNQLSELKRQINGIRIYLKEVEDYGNTKIASGSWQEQRDRQNIANFAQRIRKILKKVEVSQSTGQYRAANILSATESPVPDYLRYNQPVFRGYQTRKTSLLNSPLPVSYGGDNQYNYMDYN